MGFYFTHVDTRRAGGARIGGGLAGGFDAKTKKCPGNATRRVVREVRAATRDVRAKTSKWGAWTPSAEHLGAKAKFGWDSAYFCG